MKKLITNFPDQLQEAISIASVATLRPHHLDIQNVVITGLGGSGIGGTIASQLVEKTAKVPVVVNKKYHIPGFVGPNTLFIVSSYSGNTEETLTAMEDAMVKKAKVVCITSGGKVADLARANDLDLIKVPGGMPPRSCLGYSLVQVLNLFTFFEITEESFINDIETSIQLIKKELTDIQTEAKLIAKKLAGKIPVIYTTDKNEGVAIRFRQQLNENSKMLAWHHVFPELNHNELVGWRRQNNDIAIVLLRNKSDFERNSKRIEISLNIFRKYCDNISEIHSKGESETEHTIYLIHLTDWVSLYLSEINQVDAMEIHVIDHLKKELAEQ